MTMTDDVTTSRTAVCPFDWCYTDHSNDHVDKDGSRFHWEEEPTATFAPPLVGPHADMWSGVDISLRRCAYVHRGDLSTAETRVELMAWDTPGLNVEQLRALAAWLTEQADQLEAPR